MEISTKKRMRSSNWGEEEKKLLRQLVIERIDVIENKDTSTNTNNMKKAAWQEVLSCFNSLNNIKRDLKELTTQWRNTKGKVKSRESEYKRAKLMTGGGPPPPSPPAEDLAIIRAIPNEFIIDSNCFDSDGLYKNTSNQSPKAASQRLETICVDPWTPLPGSSNQIIKDIEKIPDDLNQTENEKIPITANKSHKQKTYIGKRCKQYKKINTNENYEQQLFLITKESKERENERAEEVHKKRIAILDLEYEYWKKKLNNIE